MEAFLLQRLHSGPVVKMVIKYFYIIKQTTVRIIKKKTTDV